MEMGNEEEATKGMPVVQAPADYRWCLDSLSAACEFILILLASYLLALDR